MFEKTILKFYVYNPIQYMVVNIAMLCICNIVFEDMQKIVFWGEVTVS